ncbi:hypothetical protein CEP53_000946 [Fusarium sp. AF-6]|nr:hypothetical protein CEP53_000946 [Fusarium sp. AF-6]
MMFQRERDRVDLEPIMFEHLLQVNDELDSAWDYYEIGFNDSKANTKFPYTASLYRMLFKDLHAIGQRDEELIVPGDGKRTYHHFCALTQAIGIAILLYSQCYVGDFYPSFFRRPVSSIIIGGYKPYARYRRPMGPMGPIRKFTAVVRLQNLMCAGKVLGSPVFTLTTFYNRTKPAMLSCTCEDLIDTFGLSNIISTNPDDRFNTLISVRIRGATIFPLMEMHSSSNQLFHWGICPHQFHEPITFSYTEKILIGAPSINYNCKLKESNARHSAKAAGSISLVYVCKPFLFQDEIQVNLQGGQYVSLTAGVVWKWNPGRSLKEAILQGYGLNKSLSFLNDLSGLQFSICTGLARRVPLRQLVVESPLFDMLDHVGMEGWESMKENVRELFKSPITLSLLKDQRRFPRGILHEACRTFLSYLEPTGVGADGYLRILWPTAEEPGYCFVVNPDKYPHLQWCDMIRDNEWCATFAAMTAVCIETEGHRCPSRDATVPWRLERSLLSTGMFQPGMAGTELKVGASYWVGDTCSGVWVTVRKPEQGTQVLKLNKRIPPSIPKFASRILGWEALRECYMRETFSTDVVVYSRKRSH